MHAPSGALAIGNSSPDGRDFELVVSTRQPIYDREFMMFDDYLKNSDTQGWITVSHNADRSEMDSRFVFSALASPGSTTDLLKTPDREVNPFWFGTPSFIKSDGKVSFKHNLYSRGDVCLEPFVIKRNFHGVRPDTYEIIQDFVLYHDLFFDHGRRAYVNLEGEEIVRAPTSCMQVREDALRDYLAARQMNLVLYHDHRRRRDIQVAEVFGKDPVKQELNKPLSKYSLTIGHYFNGEALSMLCGKKIVQPYKEPLHRDYVSVIDKPESYETYICLKDGERVEKSCDVESGRQPGPHLTPVFFKKEVLSKYHNSSLYDVHDNTIWYLDFWGIEFGNNGDLIHAWLGYLGRIPSNEQKHWRQYNVTPRDGLGENFVHRQLLTGFAPSSSRCEALLALKSQVNKNFRRRFGFALFRDLPKGTAEPHDLSSDEEQEFNEQILNLVKNFVDAINEKDLLNPKQKSDGSLKTLDRFLVGSGLAIQRAQDVVGALRMVQGFRSEGAAHLRGQNYEKRLRHLGLENMRPRDRFNVIVAILGKQLLVFNDRLKLGRD